MQLNLNQITITVSNIAESIAFYKNSDLRLIIESSDYARFKYIKGEATFSLHLSDLENSNNLTCIYFETEKLEEDTISLRDKGVVFDLLPTEQSWLWKEAHLKDLDGNRIILYSAGENRKNPPWRLE